MASFRAQPFRRFCKDARQNTFHYSDNEVTKAIAARIEYGSELSGLTLSSDPELNRIDLGDDVYDSLLCRIVWQLPPEEDLGPNADRILEEIWNVAVKFLDFCDELVLPILKGCAP